MSEAIGFLRRNGVNPPSEIISYLENNDEEVRMLYFTCMCLMYTYRSLAPALYDAREWCTQ